MGTSSCKAKLPVSVDLTSASVESILNEMLARSTVASSVCACCFCTPAQETKDPETASTSNEVIHFFSI